MDHLETRVHPDSAFCVTGRAPTYEQMKDIVERGSTAMSPEEHRFHFYVDSSAKEVLVLWFCGSELRQHKMDADQCVVLLVGLEACGFKTMELELH